MTTHVFIVDNTTLKYHLEYMFAGTGAKDNLIDFNATSKTKLKAQTENNSVGMIADSQRVRKGDYVIFYLQQNTSQDIYEGKFYGIFKIASNSFLDNLKYSKETLNLVKDYNFKYPKDRFKFNINKKEVLLKTALTIKEKNSILGKLSNSNDNREIENFIARFYQNNQFLLEKLEKSLTFRALIDPYEVYSKGVTEWEALDEIKHIQSPNQMLWSLIYRKLKGNRGNTMITIYESERLFKLLRDKNEKKTLKGSNFTYDISTQEIIRGSNKNSYSGRKEQIDILPRLITKYNEKKAFETHLQAYIIQNIGKKTNQTLDACLLNGTSLEWIGNEVSCGVGMQRIDVMLSLIKKDIKIAMPIELKAVEANTDNIFQIQRYVDWLEQYYIHNRISDIQPVLIVKKIDDKKQSYYKDIINSFKEFNRRNNKCLPLKYIEYDLKNSKLEFKSENY